MNPLSRKSTEEIIINAFEAKVAKAAAEKIDAVLDGTYKLIYDEICEMFGDEAEADVVERCVDEICNSVNNKIMRKMRNEL
jgi:hypothetical protein